MNEQGRAHIENAIIVLLLFAWVWLDIPWLLLPVIAVVLIPVGILAIAFRQKPFMLSPPDATDPMSPLVPPSVRNKIEAVLNRMEGSGFLLVEPWSIAMSETTLDNVHVLLQQRESSDLALISVSENGQSLEFQRRRGDGSVLETAASSIAQLWPPPPNDDCFYVQGAVDPLVLWNAHRARVARDPMVTRNPTVTDPVVFIARDAERVHQSYVAARIMTRMSDNQLRVSLKGVFLVFGRGYSPWTIVQSWRGKRALAALETETRTLVANGAKPDR